MKIGKPKLKLMPIVGVAVAAGVITTAVVVPIELNKLVTSSDANTRDYGEKYIISTHHATNPNYANDKESYGIKTVYLDEENISLTQTSHNTTELYIGGLGYSNDTIELPTPTQDIKAAITQFKDLVARHGVFEVE